MRLLSYNIHEGIGGRDRRYRMDRILQVIERENPDLLCLQEVAQGSTRSYHHDQPRMLAECVQAAAQLFQLNVRWKRGGYGNQVLSRWPFLSHHQISLRWNGKKARGGQIVAVDSPEGPLLVVNWHLGLGERERDWQARHLLGHRLFLESAHLPTLIAGDFNDWRDALAPGPMLRQGFRQVTVPPWRFRSFPAYLALGSLDKAFHRGALGIRHVRIIRSRLTRAASDHLPLVIDFHLLEELV